MFYDDMLTCYSKPKTPRHPYRLGNVNVGYITTVKHGWQCRVKSLLTDFIENVTMIHLIIISNILSISI